MDFPVDEILASLQATLQQLLPTNLTNTTLALNLLPQSTKTAGIGSVVALSDSPMGEIHGYHMAAEVRIRVSTTVNEATLDMAISRLAAAFSGLSRKRRVELGILRLSLAELSPELRQLGQGNNSALEKIVTCQVLYEFLKRPEDSEEIIQTVPLNLQLSQGHSG